MKKDTKFLIGTIIWFIAIMVGASIVGITSPQLSTIGELVLSLGVMLIAIFGGRAVLDFTYSKDAGRRDKISSEVSK